VQKSGGRFFAKPVQYQKPIDSSAPPKPHNNLGNIETAMAALIGIDGFEFGKSACV
jgi:hypothetical protein